MVGAFEGVVSSSMCYNCVVQGVMSGVGFRRCVGSAAESIINVLHVSLLSSVGAVAAIFEGGRLEYRNRWTV